MEDDYVTYTDISYMYNSNKPNYSFVDYNNFDNNYLLDKKEVSYYKLEKSNFEEEFIHSYECVCQYVYWALPWLFKA